MPQEIDWNATAAWIALIVSVVGTIASPIITAIITNHHQTELRKLDIQEKNAEEYNRAKHAAFDAFISDTGRYLTSHGAEATESFSKSFHIIYQYVPCEMWSELDEFYLLMRQCDTGSFEQALQKHSKIIHDLSAILKEVPQ